MEEEVRLVREQLAVEKAAQVRARDQVQERMAATLKLVEAAEDKSLSQNEAMAREIQQV